LSVRRTAVRPMPPLATRKSGGRYGFPTGHRPELRPGGSFPYRRIHTSTHTGQSACSKANVHTHGHVGASKERRWFCALLWLVPGIAEFLVSPDSAAH
jgi:hypothetical protein